MSDDFLDVDVLAEPETESKSAKKTKPQPEKRLGLFSHLGHAVTAPLAKIRPEQFLTWKSAGLFIGAFLLVWLFLVNWAPVRVLLWFWTVDVPKAIAFLVDASLGAVLMWLWIRWRERVKVKGAERK
ncbi:MAG: LapA family protein [Candidatus Zipacnadales bacterium]